MTPSRAREPRAVREALALKQRLQQSLHTLRVFCYFQVREALTLKQRLQQYDMVDLDDYYVVSEALALKQRLQH